jgi:hypothetical protein
MYKTTFEQDVALCPSFSLSARKSTLLGLRMLKLIEASVVFFRIGFFVFIDLMVIAFLDFHDDVVSFRPFSLFFVALRIDLLLLTILVPLELHTSAAWACVEF